MNMYEALKEYFESVGGIVIFDDSEEVQYSFANGSPNIDEVAEKFGAVCRL